jgi:3'-5' exoribonuclease
MKDIYITDLSKMDEGKPFDTFFLLLAVQQRTTSTGKPYLSLTLGDKSGQVEGRAWEPADPRIARDLVRGELVKVRGSVSRFKETLQVKVDQIRFALPTEADLSDMLPSTTYNVDDLWKQLITHANSITDPYLNHLISTLLDDPKISTAYKQAPAAKQLHHAWIGGLLEHVVSLLNLADRVLPNYPILNRDLVLTGVILHDIGKTRELEWASGFDYTVEGTLLGHIQFGAALAEKTIDAIPNFPPRLKTIVLHLILSHHGKLEFGSPKLPMIPEALALNFLDDFDAKMQVIATEFERAAQQGKGPSDFTDKVWALDQRQMLNTKRWLEEEK